MLPNPKIKPPPSSEEWEAMARTALPWTRLAWESLYLSKTEMLATIERERADPVFAAEITQGVRHAAAFLGAMAGICWEAYRRRLLCGEPFAD
ncbi:MAG: hypothetical protein ABSF67_03530 [Roseiarcus sp.]